MPTRIAFSTTWPDRMGDLAGKPSRFPEKIIKGLRLKYNESMEPGMRNLSITERENVVDIHRRDLREEIGKTTTIRSNYEYWKKKEGQLIQPFFWAGKPYRSKHVVFCPEVRLNGVLRINLDVNERRIFITAEEDGDLYKKSFISFLNGKSEIDLTKDEGFDHPDHFWMWFNQDFNGALLELESVEG